MKIAIEAQRIFRKEKHGMDYVALETIRELQKIDQQNEYFILVSPGDDVCLQESANMHIVTVNWPSYPLWEQIGLPLALKKIKPDLLHCTSNTAPVYGNIPLMLTLHDIIFLEKKQGKNQSMYQRLGRFYRKIIVPQILTKCKRIITVSHFECNRISHFLHIDKYNPQIQISAESETKRSIFREKDKTKRSKKESAQHSKSRNKSFVMTSVSAL